MFACAQVLVFGAHAREVRSGGSARRSTAAARHQVFGFRQGAAKQRLFTGEKHMHVCMFVLVRVCVCVLVCMCLHTCVCVYVCLSYCAFCACMCVRSSMKVFARSKTFVDVLENVMCLCRCICARAFISTATCACGCVYMRVQLSKCESICVMNNKTHILRRLPLAQRHLLVAILTASAASLC